VHNEDVVGMNTLATAGLVIAVLIATGQFLDKEYLDNTTKEATRLGLIRMYVWLYDIPGDFVGRFADLVHNLYRPIEYDIRIGRP
jgi:hypothetical protein